MSDTFYFIDAPGFGDTITATLTRNHTSHAGQTTTTITGTAVFTWTRVKLADQVKCPRFPWTDGGGPSAGRAVDKGKFLAWSDARGRMPGWRLYMGSQDPIPDAYTQTYTEPGQTPVVTHYAASCDLGAATCRAAPGRPMFSGANSAGENSLTGHVGGGQFLGPVPITVTLLRPQQAATDKIPAVGPLYRVTIPSDCDLGSNSDGGYPGDFAYIVYNGQNYPPSDPQNGFTGFYSLSQLPGSVLFRAANVADVLLAYGDTLGGGMIYNYGAFASADVISIDTESYGNLSLPITNPFPMRGQSFTHSDDQGLTVRVSF